MLATSRHQRRLPVFSLLGTLLCLLLLAACGGSSGATENPTATTGPTATTAGTATQGTSNAAATITMGGTNFTGTPNVTIKKGESVKFDDTNGGFHILVIGTHGTFQAQNGAPPELNTDTGTTFSGDAKTITFTTAGTYKITCRVHPPMQATVTVQ